MDRPTDPLAYYTRRARELNEQLVAHPDSRDLRHRRDVCARAAYRIACEQQDARRAA